MIIAAWSASANDRRNVWLCGSLPAPSPARQPGTFFYLHPLNLILWIHCNHYVLIHSPLEFTGVLGMNSARPRLSYSASLGAVSHLSTGDPFWDIYDTQDRVIGCDPVVLSHCSGSATNDASFLLWLHARGTYEWDVSGCCLGAQRRRGWNCLLICDAVVSLLMTGTSINTPVGFPSSLCLSLHSIL